MGLEINDSGTWKPADAVHIKDSGSWKSADSVWEKVNGSWQEVWAALISIDTFDNGLDSGWSGDTGHFSPTTSFVQEGAGAVITDTPNDLSDINSTSGLPAYFGRGETLRLYVYQDGTGDGQVQLWFGYADGDNHYRAYCNFNDKTRLVEINGGIGSTHDDDGTADPPVNTWLMFEIVWNNDDTLEYRLYDASDMTQIGSTLTGTYDFTSEYTGLAIRTNRPGAQEIVIDHLHKPQ